MHIDRGILCTAMAAASVQLTVYCLHVIARAAFVAMVFYRQCVFLIVLRRFSGSVRRSLQVVDLLSLGCLCLSDWRRSLW